jgi:UDP-N-acetylglucosamine--N-acetylmuramyl-(pentapeptide) pyrophosphoryl-undecaprenol N-acetylglucosamine transferase
MNTTHRIVLTGGGTGGHISPALALAEGLQSSGIALEQLLYIGNETGLESQLVPASGLAFQTICVSGMPRSKNPLPLLAWLWVLGQAIFHARQLLLTFKPSYVIGTGGYVSAPVLIAAKLVGIPFHIHEPDAQPGLVNRLMGRHAHSVSVAFDDSKRNLIAVGVSAHRISVTGNPLRHNIMVRLLNSTGTSSHLSNTQQELLLRQLGFSPILAAKTPPLILVLGGSQGARTLNQATVGALTDLLQQGFLVWHQTGPKLFGETLDALDELSALTVATDQGEQDDDDLPEWTALKEHPGYRCQAYIQDMGPVLAVASLAVCRSGSLSLSEMLVANVPMILVPYPYAAANHQTRNAQALVTAGAAVLLPDADCNANNLTTIITNLFKTQSTLTQMRQACQRLAKPYATQTIVKLLLDSQQD